MHDVWFMEAGVKEQEHGHVHLVCTLTDLMPLEIRVPKSLVVTEELHCNCLITCDWSNELVYMRTYIMYGSFISEAC